MDERQSVDLWFKFLLNRYSVDMASMRFVVTLAFASDGFYLTMLKIGSPLPDLVSGLFFLFLFAANGGCLVCLVMLTRQKDKSNEITKDILKGKISTSKEIKERWERKK